MDLEIKEWLSNSVQVTEKSPEEYKSNYEYELKIRKEIAQDFTGAEFSITPDSIEGTYRIMGQNPEDPESCYIGSVDIEYNEGTWLATWSISGFTHYAYGMLVSPTILVFNFSYLDNDNDPHTGIVAYTFLSSAIVRGEWIEEGYPEKGIEELRKLEDDESDYNDMHDANFGFSLN